jgi:hypothetical protein
MSGPRLHEIELSAIRASARRAPRTSAGLRGAAALAVTTLAAFAWWYIEPGSGAAPEPALPALQEREATCTAPELQRGQRGRDARAQAAAKIARYPFAPEEGLPALQLLLESERCFELAGDRAALAAAAAHVRAWRARLHGGARDHWLRYRVALASERPHHALPDIEFLLALFGSEAGPFAARLRRAQLELPQRNRAEEMP